MSFTATARDAFLSLAHHNAIAHCGRNILEAGITNQLEFRNLDAEGLEIIAKESAQVAAIEDIAEELDQNSSFWPQNSEEWGAFVDIMAPLIGELVIGFIPGSDAIELFRAINNNDALGASIAMAGLIVDVAGLSAIKGAIKGVKIFRKAIKIGRKLGAVLKAAGKAAKKGFKTTLDAAGNLILKKGDDVLESSDDLVKKALEKISTPGARKFWTNQTTFRNVKVYKRDDIINGGLVDNIGRTNKQRMQAGIAPIGPDGKSVNLHHMLQSDAAGIAEMTETFHKTNHRTIHINPNTIPSGIDRSAFATWKRNYWKNRANDF